MSTESASVYVLSPKTLEAIISLEDHIEVLVETYRALGIDLRDENLEPFSPWDYKIPQEQWLAICGRMNELNPVNGGLLFMNKGPSSNG
jgi:hypothetical protein